MGFLSNKRALIMGLVSNRSIAHGIAEALHREGASLAFTYQNEKLKERVNKLTAAWNTPLAFPCDVSSDEEINSLFEALKNEWDSLDILIHSIAFAPREQLEGDYLENVTREGFKIAQDISSYSLAAVSKLAAPMMANRNAAILTLTYHEGSIHAVPNYNVMGVAKASLEANMRYIARSLGPKGIRVNAISAGPIKTLAASGIKGFGKMLAFNEQASPLRRNTTLTEVGNAAAFLCSDLASGITGEILHVDSGYHAIGMSGLESE